MKTTIYVWPETQVERVKSRLAKQPDVDVLPVNEDYAQYLIYDYLKGSFLEPQGIVEIRDEKGSKAIYNWLDLEKARDIPKPSNELRAKLYNYYQEVYGENLAVSEDLVKEVKEYLSKSADIKLHDSVVELLLKSIFSGTAFIYTPYKDEVVELIKKIFDLVNEYSGTTYTYAISDLDEEKDYLIITFPIYEDIFTVENNLIFVYDYQDVVESSEDLLYDFQVFCPVGGYIWRS